MQGKVIGNDSAAMEVHAGIDVCKKWLDIAIHPYGHYERFENTGKGIKKLIRWLSSYRVALIVMEATGKLHRKAHEMLHNAGLAVAIVNPLRSRLFAEAVGKLAKTDKIDAQCLALMAASLKPAAMAPRPEPMEDLHELLVAAAALVVGLSELGACSAKQAAMLAGLAPVACESGESKGARHIRSGRGSVRRGIYMAAVSAINHNKSLKAFYDHLIAAGKPKKVALTAVMRKLVVIANTLLTKDRFWQAEAPKCA